MNNPAMTNLALTPSQTEALERLDETLRACADAGLTVQSKWWAVPSNMSGTIAVVSGSGNVSCGE